MLQPCFLPEGNPPRKGAKEQSKQSIIIADDSIVKNIHQNKISRDKLVKEVRSFPGATTDDFQDYVKPLIREQPSYLILHVRTNNSPSEEPESTAEKILPLKRLVNKLSPRTEVIISSLITRTDRKKLHQKVKEVNNILFSNNLNIIDNSNVKSRHLNRSKLHLNKSGDATLAHNFRMKIRSLLKSLIQTNC